MMRFLYIGIAAVVAMVIVVAAVGWMLPVRHRASVERTYRASPAALFSLITDVAAFPSWRRELLGVDVLTEEDGHPRWRERTKSGTPITLVLERAIPDPLVVGRIADANLPFGGGWTYELMPASNGATTLRITEDGEVHNPIFRFVSRFVMGHDATIKQYLSAVGTRFPEVATAQ